MNLRRPSFLLAAASAVFGALGGIFSGRGGSVLASESAGGPRGPRPAPKSYIRGRGPQWVGRAVETGKERCDARNHGRGKQYSAFDDYHLFLADIKRERKQIKRVKDAEAQRRGTATYGLPWMHRAA